MSFDYTSAAMDIIVLQEQLAGVKKRNDALLTEKKELRAALVSAVDALSDFDYDKRMAAIAKCREVMK
jgi:hypothetical protein